MIRQACSPQSIRPAGFSLLELIAVITIMGVLVLVVTQRISVSGVKAKAECCKQYQAELNRALERYNFETGDFPATLDDLGNSEYYPESVPHCPVTAKPYQIDAATGRIQHPAH
ncbi:MAG: prepilin-type N-terminal cleavage/methylation domain-containing protein [Pirellulaceae bacterium]